MCISKVEAWQFAGKTYPTEDQAIRAAVYTIIGNEGLAQSVIGRSHKLIPLLQRIVEIEAEKQAGRTTPDTTEDDSEDATGEPKPLGRRRMAILRLWESAAVSDTDHAFVKFLADNGIRAKDPREALSRLSSFQLARAEQILGTTYTGQEE